MAIKKAAKKSARKAAKKTVKKAAKKAAKKTAKKTAKKAAKKPAKKAAKKSSAYGYSGPRAYQRPATRPRPIRAPEAAPSAYRPSRLSIRMYRHGLGDCLLLRFAKRDGGTFNILIDCGLISVASNPKDKMQAVVEDINNICNSVLDVVVMTHEHWDHASGFSKQQAQDLFAGLTIREVWYAWTEDPSNNLGRKLRREREAKVKAISLAAKALAGLASSNPLAARRSDDLGNFLGFFGMDLTAAKSGTGNIGKTRAAFEYPGGRAGVRVRYRHPEDAPLSLRDVDNVRVFVLGPPEDEVLLKKSRPTKSGREVYEFSAELGVTTSLERAFDRLAGAGAATSASDCPFDETYHARRPSPELAELQAATWSAPGQEWRQIDLDWTQAAENLAIDLDTHTNNSCLVLAFQFTDTEEVFLFPADAQVGNWLSWQDLTWKVRGEDGPEEVTALDLLAQTVFYKVGHHGSHNATLRDLGLELMTSEDLTAFIPVVEAEAKKYRWNEMPFRPLTKRLEQRTRGRLLRSDDTAPPRDSALKALTTQERARFRSSLVEGDDSLYYELNFG